jgi:hypothetical protein
MHTRSRAAATALLLTASAAGLAVTNGAAHATGTHPSSKARAATLTVTITSTRSGPKLSTSSFRPGKTLFKVLPGHTGGSIQVLRLRPGYSLRHAASDFGKIFGPSTDVRAVRRIDKNVVFYGGMGVPAAGAKANWWGTDLDKAGRYYAVNLDKNTVTPFTTKGTHQRRSLPASTGWLNMATDTTGANAWRSPATDPNRGWMKTTNNAEEPHFVVLDQVTESTTDADVQAALSSPNPPAFDLGTKAETNIISPGHSFVWHYGAPKGKYLSMCFWPSRIDGTPHALMGMFKLFHLG